MGWIPKVGDKVRVTDGPIRGEIGIVSLVVTAEETQADGIAMVDFESYSESYPWDELEPVGGTE